MLEKMPVAVICLKIDRQKDAGWHIKGIEAGRAQENDEKLVWMVWKG